MGSLLQRFLCMLLRLFFMISLLEDLALSQVGDATTKLNPNNSTAFGSQVMLAGALTVNVKFGLLVSGAALTLITGIALILLKISIQKLLTWVKFVRNGGSFLPKSSDRKFKLFKLEELKLATSNFARGRVLGEGGQGTVFLGWLEDRTPVAVKVAKAVRRNMRDKFINEAVILTKLNHPHIVPLLGFCLNTDTPILVYKYVDGKTLRDYIHKSSTDYEVSWKVHHRIMIQLAQALYFMHNYSHPIYHRDIKPANILLDKNDKACLADFGLAKLNKTDVHLLKLSSFIGTPGFMCPEMYHDLDYNEKSDIYLFGLVLVEMLTGQQILDSTLKVGLATHFYECVKLGRKDAIFDKRICTNDNEEVLWNIALISQACIRPKRVNRPNMKEVLGVLEGSPIPAWVLNYIEEEAEEYPTLSLADQLQAIIEEDFPEGSNIV